MNGRRSHASQLLPFDGHFCAHFVSLLTPFSYNLFPPTNSRDIDRVYICRRRCNIIYRTSKDVNVVLFAAVDIATHIVAARRFTSNIIYSGSATVVVLLLAAD
jgi:hypothetical protein